MGRGGRGLRVRPHLPIDRLLRCVGSPAASEPCSACRRDDVETRLIHPELAAGSAPAAGGDIRTVPERPMRLVASLGFRAHFWLRFQDRFGVGERCVRQGFHPSPPTPLPQGERGAKQCPHPAHLPQGERGAKQCPIRHISLNGGGERSKLRIDIRDRRESRFQIALAWRKRGSGAGRASRDRATHTPGYRDSRITCSQSLSSPSSRQGPLSFAA